MNELKVTLADEQSTTALGAKLAAQLTDGLVVFLSGDLGAGKTCVVRGMLQALGHEGPVKSPTYTLVEDYSLSGHDIYHFDLYRLHDPEELDLIGIRDYFDGRASCFIEWPERGHGWLPKQDLEIRITVRGEGREAVISASSEKGEHVLAALS